MALPRACKIKIAPDIGLAPELCFSFSGLKTALLYYVRRNPDALRPGHIERLAAAYQDAIVSALTRGARHAILREKIACLAVAGGVSLNRCLRAALQELAATMNVRLLLAEPDCCVDNAAMVAGLAGSGGGVAGNAALMLDVCPNLEWGMGGS